MADERGISGMLNIWIMENSIWCRRGRLVACGLWMVDGVLRRRRCHEVTEVESFWFMDSE